MQPVGEKFPAICKNLRFVSYSIFLSVKPDNESVKPLVIPPTPSAEVTANNPEEHTSR